MDALAGNGARAGAVAQGSGVAAAAERVSAGGRCQWRRTGPGLLALRVSQPPGSIPKTGTAPGALDRRCDPAVVGVRHH